MFKNFKRGPTLRLFIASLLFLSFPLYAEEIFITPYEDSDLNSDEALSLTSPSIQNYLNEKINNSQVLIHKEFQNGSMLIHFSQQGIPFCFEEIKAIHVGNTLTMIGDIPKNQDSDELSFKEPHLFKSEQQSLALHKDAKILDKRLCLYSRNESAKAVWEFTLQTSSFKAYKVWADDTHVYKKAPLFFDMETHNIQSYDRDPVSNLHTKLFKEEVSDKSLSNSYFLTDPSTNESGIEHAIASPSGDYIFSPEEDSFAEASLFVHVNEHLKFFKSLGYNWTGPNPLIVKFHTLEEDARNNAYYQIPNASQSSPLIVIGEADGVMLKNLALDSDVVSHELGHHIIFKNIRKTTGESLVLHEGLADYFVFAKTGDSCLGRSICVADSPVCIVDQCLRVASKTLEYESKTYKDYNAHRRGQLVSGFIFELQEFIEPKLVTQMTYNSLDLLASNSGFKHLILALMLTDYKMNQGVNACKIYDAAVKRGFGNLIKNLDCHKLDSLNFTEASTSPKVSSRSKKNKVLGCTGFSGLRSEKFDATAFFLIIPIAIRRKFKLREHKIL